MLVSRTDYFPKCLYWMFCVTVRLAVYIFSWGFLSGWYFWDFSPPHLEGSSTSGYCSHSAVIADKNVDIRQCILLRISSDSVHLNFLLPPCPALFLSCDYHLYVSHVHTITSASDVLLLAELLSLSRSIHFLCGLRYPRNILMSVQHPSLLSHCPAFSPIYMSW